MLAQGILTRGRDFMAETNEKAQQSRIDARQLVLPMWMIVAIIGAAVSTGTGAGIWIARTGDRAATVPTIAAELKTLGTQLATLQGSVNVLVGMQESVSDLKAKVDGLEKELEEEKREQRLFRDFVEGRIGSMPYRPSSSNSGGSP